MKIAPANADATVASRERVQLEGDLSPTQARALLKLHFSSNDLERMRALSAKARAGTLTPDEEADISTYEWLGCLLDVLHSKARRVLRKRKTAS